MTFYATPSERKIALKYILKAVEKIKENFPEEAEFDRNDLEELIEEYIRYFIMRTGVDEVDEYLECLNGFLGFKKSPEKLKKIYEKYKPINYIELVSNSDIVEYSIKISKDLENKLAIKLSPEINENLINNLRVNSLTNLILEKGLHLILNDFQPGDEESYKISDYLIRIIEAISDYVVRTSLGLGVRKPILCSISINRSKLYDLLDSLTPEGGKPPLKLLSLLSGGIEEKKHNCGYGDIEDETTERSIKAFYVKNEIVVKSDDDNKFLERFKSAESLEKLLMWYPERRIYICPQCGRMVLPKNESGAPKCDREHSQKEMREGGRYIILDRSLMDSVKSNRGLFPELYVTEILRKFLYENNINAFLANRVMLPRDNEGSPSDKSDEVDVLCLILKGSMRQIKIILFEVKFSYHDENEYEKLLNKANKLKELVSQNSLDLEIIPVFVYLDERKGPPPQGCEGIRIVDIDSLRTCLPSLLYRN